MKQDVIVKELKRLIAMCFSSALLAFVLKSFVWSGNLVTGGAAGLTVLILAAAKQLAGITLPYTAVNLAINAVPVYIGFRYIGKKFTATSLVVIVMTGLLTDTIPAIEITSDPLLCAVFGGILTGLAISVCLRSGTTTGGTDFISIYLSEKKGIDSFNIILGFNCVVLVFAGLLHGWDAVLYSIILQYASTQVLHILYRRYQKNTLLIVTEQPQKVFAIISRDAHHSATILYGEGGYVHGKKALVYSVLESDQAKPIIREIRQTEPDAFINVLRTEEISGRFHLRPND